MEEEQDTVSERVRIEARVIRVYHTRRRRWGTYIQNHPSTA